MTGNPSPKSKPTTDPDSSRAEAPEVLATRASPGGADTSRWLLRVGPAAPLAALGGKARSLAKLAALGLPTPAAFVVKDALFRALLGRAAADDVLSAPWPEGFLLELGAALSELGAGVPTAEARFAVRSSFADEDDAEALAAGVYLSELPVAAGDVPGAVRRVLASALAPGARAYAARVGRSVGVAPVAVLIHRYLEARFSGSVALSAPSAEDARLEVRADDDRIVNETSLGRELARALRTAAAMVAQHLGSADLEWAAASEAPVFLQWRPDTRVGRRRDDDDPWLGRLRARGIDDAWVWDAAHNPAPLSPAQAGLVAMVVGRCRLPFAMAVVEGYLFYGPRPHEEPGTTADSAAAHGVGPRLGFTRGSALNSREEAASFWQEVSQSLTAHLAAWEQAIATADEVEHLVRALQLYALGYQQLFGTLQPWLSRARRELRAFLVEQASSPGDLGRVESELGVLLSGVPSVATERRALAAAWAAADSEPAREVARAAYLARFGDESSTWDIAVPTWRERAPARREAGRPSTAAASTLEGAGPRESSKRAVLSPEQRVCFEERLAAARLAVALGEGDDALFARLQAIVRRSLLALGRVLRAKRVLSAEDDVFFLAWPDELARACVVSRTSPEVPAKGARDGAELAAAAAEGRRRWRAAQATPPPATWALPAERRPEEAPGAGPPAAAWDETSRAGSAERAVFRGVGGSPGRAIGRVLLHGAAAECDAPGAPSGDEPRVVVATTLLPTELPLVEAVALVTETGGALGHVAAQARERGLPAVVSLTAATRVLLAGTWVLVDGDLGTVTVLDGPPS